MDKVKIMFFTAPVNTSRGYHELEEQRNENMSAALETADSWMKERNLIPMAS